MSKFELTYVIEDNPITATITKLLLEKNLRDVRVQTYSNGQRALDHLRAALQTGADVPDLILLDLNMPLMDGWEFLDAFTSLPLAHPVCILVLTSSINPEDRAKAALYQNVAGYFAKPLDISGLARMLRLHREALGPGPVRPSLPGGPLHHLVYQSYATVPLTESELVQLLIQSRAFNAAHGLTGVLLYSNGNIVQLLEGSETHIRAVFARIARDPRHTGVVKLSDGPASQRLFAQWSMGFQVLNPADFTELTGYLNLSQANYLTADVSLSDSDLHMLLANFVVAINPPPQKTMHLVPHSA